jgi:hypothetical protein
MSTPKATAPGGRSIFPPQFQGRYLDPAYLLKCDLEKLLKEIPDPRQENILRIYEEHKDLFHTNPGSSHNHQAWKGGYADHLAAMLRHSWLEYDLCDSLYGPLPFTLGSAQVAIFCHDAEKLYLYGPPTDCRCEPFHILTRQEGKECIKWRVLQHWLGDYCLLLTAPETNAVKYTHGEGVDYRSGLRVMNELAAFVANLDRASARIGHGSGKGLG